MPKTDKIRVELDSGSRRKKWWCKEVTSLDRNKAGGYALEGRFVYAGLREFEPGAALVEYYDGGARVVLVTPDVESGLYEGEWISWPDRALEALDAVEEILNDPEAALATCAASCALANEQRAAAAAVAAVERAAAVAALKRVLAGNEGVRVLARVGIPSGMLRSSASVGSRHKVPYVVKEGTACRLRDGIGVVEGKIASGYAIAGAVIGIPVGLNVATANGWEHEALDAPLQRLAEARAAVQRLESELEVARKVLVRAEAAVVEVEA